MRKFLSVALLAMVCTFSSVNAKAVAVDDHPPYIVAIDLQSFPDGAGGVITLVVITWSDGSITYSTSA